MEFLVQHNQVIGTQRTEINPYHLGFVLWHEIRRQAAGEEGPAGQVDLRRLAEGGSEPLPGEDDLFMVREVDRDVSFLRRFLGEELMRNLDLFEYQAEGEDLVARRISDPDGWARVKEILLQQVGMGAVPVIRILDADVDRSGILLLKHEHDGRDLELEYARRTLEHVQGLWGRAVLLDTVVDGTPTRLSLDPDSGFDREKLSTEAQDSKG